MTERACSMGALVEARRDGRLDERGDASVERHLSGCVECARLARDLDRLAVLARRPSPSPSGLAHRRGRVRLLQDAAQPPVAPRLAFGWHRAAAFGAVSAMLALVAARAGQPAQLAVEAMHVAVSVPAPVRTETTIAGGDGARFSRAGARGDEIVTLDHGELSISVRLLAAGERFVVRTRDADVVVHGTVFRVTAAHGRLVRVEVSEGRVEMRREGRATMLDAGQAWDAPPEVVAAANAEVAPRGRDASSARALSAPVHVGSPPARPGAPEPAEDPRGRTLAEGVRRIEQGDFAGASKALDAFSTEHPDDARAEDAAFLSIVALVRAGRPSEAAAAARRYLARFPTGFRRGEVETIASDDPQPAPR